jgi:hypothetical protein
VCAKESPAHHHPVTFRDQILDFVSRVRQRRADGRIVFAECLGASRPACRPIVRRELRRHDVVRERHVPVDVNLFVEATDELFVRSGDFFGHPYPLSMNGDQECVKQDDGQRHDARGITKGTIDLACYRHAS